MTGNTEYTKMMNRRKVLQTVSSVGVLSAGTSSVSAQSSGNNESIGQVEFSEIGITYEIVNNLSEEWQLVSYTVDKSAGHVINQNSSRLYITYFAPDNTASTFNSEDQVFFGSKYSVPPNQVTQLSTDMLVINRGNSNRVTEVVPISSDALPIPEISAEFSRRSVTADVPGESVRADPGENAVGELPAHPVRVQARRQSTNGDESRRNIVDKTITVRPTISVNNIGSVEVIDATDEHSPTA